MAEITQLQRDGLYELTDSARASLVDSKYFNEDLAPTTLADRNWNTFHISMLWVAMAICLPSLTMAAGGVGMGLPVWASVLNVVLGNAIILVPIQLNSHAGTKYGIPFPVFSRLTFGMRGAQIPTISRAITACGWNAVQSAVFGGVAILMIVKAISPTFNDASIPAQVIAFIIFMALCGYVTAGGAKWIRNVESVSSPILVILCVALIIWATRIAAGAGYSFGEVFSTDLSEAPIGSSTEFAFIFLSMLTLNIAFWATMALNIPDFSRYAKNQKVQFRGQMYGMLPAMAFCAIVGAFFAQAMFLAHGVAEFNPVAVLGFLGEGAAIRVLTIVIGLAVIFATLTTNIAANIVAPANGFSNLAPRKISYKGGVLIACLVAAIAYGIPYFYTLAYGGRFIDFMFTFLNVYGGFLAPLASIFILDYYFIKKKNIDVAALYQNKGRYWYSGGFNVHAIIAWICGAIIPTIAGLAGFNTMDQGAMAWINANAYLFSFFVALIVYAIIKPRGGVCVLSDEEEAAITAIE